MRMAELKAGPGKRANLALAQRGDHRSKTQNFIRGSDDAGKRRVDALAWPYCQEVAGRTRLGNATVAGRSKSRRQSFSSHLASAADQARRIIRSAEFSCASIPLPGLPGVRNHAQDF